MGPIPHGTRRYHVLQTSNAWHVVKAEWLDPDTGLMDLRAVRAFPFHAGGWRRPVVGMDNEPIADNDSAYAQAKRHANALEAETP